MAKHLEPSDKIDTSIKEYQEKLKEGVKTLKDVLGNYKGLGTALLKDNQDTLHVWELIKTSENNGEFTLSTLLLDAGTYNLNAKLIYTLAKNIHPVVLNTIVELFKLARLNIIDLATVTKYFDEENFLLKKPNILIKETFEKCGLDMIESDEISPKDLGKRINLGIISYNEYPVIMACYPFMMSLISLTADNLVLKRNVSGYNNAWVLGQIGYKYKVLAKDEKSLNCVHASFETFCNGFGVNLTEDRYLKPYENFKKLDRDKRNEVLKYLITWLNSKNVVMGTDGEEFGQLFIKLTIV